MQIVSILAHSTRIVSGVQRRWSPEISVEDGSFTRCIDSSQVAKGSVRLHKLSMLCPPGNSGHCMIFLAQMVSAIIKPMRLINQDISRIKPNQDISKHVHHVLPDVLTSPWNSTWGWQFHACLTKVQTQAPYHTPFLCCICVAYAKLPTKTLYTLYRPPMPTKTASKKFLLAAV